jgi:hypothetical protein
LTTSRLHESPDAFQGLWTHFFPSDHDLRAQHH